MNPNIVVTLYQHVVKTSRKTSLKTVVRWNPNFVVFIVFLQLLAQLTAHLTAHLTADLTAPFSEPKSATVSCIPKAIFWFAYMAACRTLRGEKKIVKKAHQNSRQ